VKDETRNLIVEELRQEYQDKEMELEDLRQREAHVFRKEKLLQEELNKLHKLARWANEEGPCPIHGHHHHSRRSGTTPAKAYEALIKINAPANLDLIATAMHDLGWQSQAGDPKAVLRTALHRMEKQGQISRSPKGLYQIK